jgi:RsiW-degrading membrane proteinase PrsW (M82 family)
MWGVVVAAGGAFILNTLVGIGVYSMTGSVSAADFATTSLSAPIVEESLKGLAVLLVFLVIRKEFDSIMDGIVYDSIVAMGFAAVENTLYIYRNGFQSGGWDGFWTLVFIRVVLVGWIHPFFTAFIGIGLAVSRTNPNLFIKVIAIPAGFILAVGAHAFHNTAGGLIGGTTGFLFGTVADYFGYALMTIFIIWMIVHERNILKRHLAEEVSSGAISTKQYFTALSPIQMRAHVSALSSGNFKETSRFYQVLAELAHKKEQFAKHGDESGNAKIIEQLRNELRTLAPVAKT